MKFRKEYPTKKEVETAIEVQAPTETFVASDGTEAIAVQSQAPLQKMSTFKQLAQVARSARIALGGQTQWIQNHKLFNKDYRDGLESPPFFVTKAFQYTSKSGYGEMLGLEIWFRNGKCFNIGLTLRDGDQKRNDMLALFSFPNAAPMGPFCMRKLNLNKGNEYYDICAYETEDDIQIEIPFTEITDSDIPF